MRAINIPIVFEIRFNPHPRFLYILHFPADWTKKHHLIQGSKFADVFYNQQGMKAAFKRKWRSRNQREYFFFFAV